MASRSAASPQTADPAATDRRSKRRRPAIGLFTAGLLVPAAAAADAPRPAPSPFSPFSPLRPAGVPDNALAQAEQLPAVPPELRRDSDTTDPADAASRPPAPPAATPAPVLQSRPAQSPGACDTDEQCKTGEICVESACTPARRKGVSALLYYHRPGRDGYRMVLPFYFSFWGPRDQTRVLVPLFADFQSQTRDGKSSRDLFVFPLLYQYHRTPEVRSHRVWPIFFANDYGERGGGAGLLPLFYGERRGDSRLAILPPLLTFYRGDKAGSDLLALGLFYARRRDERRLFFLPPLLSFYRDDPKTQFRDALVLPALTYVRRNGDSAGGWILGLGWYSRKGEDLKAGVLPLFWHGDDGKRRVSLGIPLFLDVKDREQGYHHTTLLPLFHHRTENNGQSRLLVTPLGGFARDKAEGTTTLALLTPPLVYRDEPRRRVFTLPPLAAVYQNKETGVSAGYVGPAFWRNDDQGSTAGFAPLYLRLHNNQPDATTHVLFPVGALHQRPGHAFGFLGPLYGWSRGAEAPGGRAYGGGLLPLFSFASGPRSHVALVPPLFTYYRDRDADLTQVTVGPIFARKRPGGYAGGLFPLLYLSGQSGPEGSSNTQLLLPLFYHHRDPAGEQALFGPGYFLRDNARFPGDGKAGVRAGLFPILFTKQTRDSAYAVVPPLFWYAREKQKQVLVLGPFFWQQRPVREPGFAPGHETTAGLFPLALVQSSPRRSIFLTPIGGVYRDRATGTSAAALLPYVHLERRDDSGGTEKLDALLPLFYSYRSPQRSAHVLFPLFTAVRDGDFHYRNAALLYHGVSRPGLSADLVFPLFLHARTPQSSLTIAGPLFYRSRTDGHGTTVGLFPLFAYHRDEQRKLLVTPLGFYAHNQQTDRTRSWFLLYYGDSRPERSDYGLFPLFFYGRRGTDRTLAMPLLLTFHSSDPARQRDTTVVGPLIYGHRGAANFFGFLPLLYGGNDGKGGYNVTLAPLFHVDHRAAAPGSVERTRFLSPLFGFARGPESSWGYLGPFYVRRDATQRSEALLPIFYHGHNVRTNVTTTMVLPLFFRSTNPESSLTAVTPLLWHYRTLTRSVTFGFPFALDVHREFQDRLTAVGPLVPLFVRYRDEAERSTTWVFPPLLLYAKTRADGTGDAVLPPLFWHFGGVDRSTTVLFPLFYRLKRPTYSAHALLPFYVHVRDDDGTKKTLVPPLLTYVRSGADGSRSVTAFPLFWHRSNAERSTTVLFPIFYRVRRPDLDLTAVFPLGAGWKTPSGNHTLVLNTYVFRGTGVHRGEWDFRFVPLIHVGRPRRTDLEWDFLEGMVGYSRLGVNRTLRLLWGIFIPMDPVNKPAAWYGATLRSDTSAAVF